MYTFREWGCDCPFRKEEWELIDQLPNNEVVRVVLGAEYELSGQYVIHQAPVEMTVEELRSRFRWARA